MDIQVLQILGVFQIWGYMESYKFGRWKLGGPREHCKSIEALDSLLRDLMEQVIFGGKTIVFGGDFRQTIPIIVGGSLEDSVNACLINSNMWSTMKKIHLIEHACER